MQERHLKKMWLDTYKENLAFYQRVKKECPHLADICQLSIENAKKRIAVLKEQLQ